MHAANEVGGDFYDFFMIDEDRLGVVLGDVSGKGVPAAIYMSLSRTLLRATALQRARPRRVPAPRQPDALHRRGLGPLRHRRLHDRQHANRRAWTTARAGTSRRPSSVPTGPSKSLPVAGGMVLGVEASGSMRRGQATLGPGDLMVLYSDGVTEAANERDEFFGDDGLDTALTRDRRRRPRRPPSPRSSRACASFAERLAAVGRHHARRRPAQIIADRRKLQSGTFRPVLHFRRYRRSVRRYGRT